MKTHDQARTSIMAQLQQEGWSVAQNAMEPLRKIDFAKLVAIHDHEEHFLEQTFIRTLMALPSARASTPMEITANDVETALRMLGVAVSRQAEATVSNASKNIIIDACGFC